MTFGIFQQPPHALASMVFTRLELCFSTVDSESCCPKKDVISVVIREG